MSRRAGRWLVEHTRARLSAFMVGASGRETSAERRYGMANARLDVFAALLAVSTLSFSACRPHSAPESESSDSASAEGGIAANANAEAVSAPTNVEAGSTLHTCDASGTTCASSEYCVFEPRLCGKGKKPGTCRPKPTQCPDSYSPICGCDGKIYPIRAIAKSFSAMFSNYRPTTHASRSPKRAFHRATPPSRIALVSPPERVV